MIQITVKRGPRGLLAGFQVEGHASFAPKGEDIVCAAVSALTQTAVMSLQKIAGIEPDVKITEGYLSCQLPDMKDDEKSDAHMLLESMILGLEETARNYSGYIKINYEG